MSEKLSLHEIYIKDDKGGVIKAGEVRGTRKQQVRLRREIRAKHDLGSHQIMLYTDGVLRRVGVDKGR
jgi:hypothetical protein